MSELKKELSRIQEEIVVPKSQYNKFGKYYFRNCEDILQAVKPILGECIIVINDSVELIGSRFYVKATVKISLNDESETAVAYARESEEQKGMQSSQLTGATSSYARKYALGGLLLLDDNKDADSQGGDDTNSITPKFADDDICKSWVDLIKKNPERIVEILDPEYAKFIQNRALK